MHLVYYDESGDDGFPAAASSHFVLAGLYCPAGDWRENFNIIHDFRRQLAKEGLLPFDLEIHTRELILNKKPYAPLRIPDSTRIEILDRFCQIISQLSARAVITVVIKPWIRANRFDVLDKALSYSIQRIENDLRSSSQNRFLIITDQGRVGKMRSTARRMQRINYLPSQFGPDSYRREIRHLIEDPLPKDSRESHFIQVADFLAYAAYLHTGISTETGNFPRRAPAELDFARLENWLNILKPVLNERASRTHPHGFVIIPSSP